MIQNHTNQLMGIKEWGLIIILSIIWGASFFFVEVALKEVTPLTIVLCRVALASLILLIIVHIKG
ncbi:MAG: EamA family transporter, partial [Desulfobacteraceae bacterium]|nr:EamA family transporter [Desulfobacteraceae bacterium]